MTTARFLGHSCWLLSHEQTTLLIDPFLSQSPVAPVPAEDVRAGWVLLTHAHFDHMLDAESIARRCGATVVANFEIASYWGAKGLKTQPLQPGGTARFDWGWVKMVPAIHGSTWEEDGRPLTLGLACGFVIHLGGKTIYHLGDTALYGDMALVGRRYTVDLALVPIGDTFTMGPDDAVDAVKLIQPRVAIPMHYDTFPPIKQDPQAWAERIRGELGIEAVVVAPGEEHRLTP
jgi:L-ascorbate metabolism protein UlaG (beta-lactamase superfamily)